MRTLLGWIVLIVGLIILGMWGRNDHAKDMQAYVTEGAKSQIGQTSLPLETRVSGRDITVKGLAGSNEEKASILAVLDETRGRRVVNDEIEVLKTAAPFLFNGIKDGETLSFAGNTPSPDALSGVLGNMTEGLELAAGVPSGDWTGFVGAGVSALKGLKNGKLEISDKTMNLSGLAGSLKDDAAVRGFVANLPEGYAANLNIEIEPKVPYVFNGVKSADSTSYSGYIPSEEARSGFADVIGADQAANLAAEFGAPDDYDMLVGFGTQALSQLKTGELKISDKSLSITGEAANPTVEQEITAMMADLPEGYTSTIDLKVTPVVPYVLNASNAGGNLSMDGYAPDTGTIAQLAQAAGADAGAVRLGAGVPDAAWGGAVATGLSALRDVDGGTLSVADRTLTMTGELDNPETYAGVSNLMGGLPEGYSANLDGLKLNTVSPYTFEASNVGDGLTGSGFAPDSDTLKAIGGKLGNLDKLTLGAGAPEGWGSVIGFSMDALSTVQDGKLTVQDQAIRLSGTVANPAASADVRAMFENLPDGYTTEFDLKELDDGQPVGLSLSYKDGEGSAVTGKLPSGLDLGGVAKALGVPSVAGNPTAGTGGDADAMAAKLRGMSRWLPFMESATAKVSDQSVDFNGVVLPGADLNTIERSLSTSLGAASKLTLNYSAKQPKDGEKRKNSVTGRDEIFRLGFWIPVVTFEVSKEVCEAESSQVLQSATINFITGSADLDPDSLQSINALAAVLLNCVGKEGLKLEIGGHTDSQGSAESNASLSLKRAASVVNALIDRGVTSDGMIAKGYGESTPIATNDTAEGRAENRRTTLTWITE